MKWVAVWIPLFSIWASFLAAAPKALEEVQSHFSQHQAFEVSFVQAMKQDLFPESNQIAKGKISFQRPNQLEWVYHEPEEKRIYYEGEGLIIERGTDREEIPQEQMGFRLETSFSFLWGEVDEDLFKIDELSEDAFILRPAEQNASFESIEVHVKDEKVQRAKVKDSLEGEAEYRFKNWRFHN